MNDNTKLRKVLFSKINEKSEFKHQGYFHKWVTYAEDGNCEEYALIEDLDGNMIETYTTRIRFID